MERQLSSPFKFESLKALQAAGVMLREEPGHCIHFMKLLKLLYIAERTSLQETGQMITGDRVFAMQRGPVLSSVCDLMNGTHSDVECWDAHIERERFHLTLKSNPGVHKLSRFQVELLQQIAREYRDKDEWEMVEVTHRFQEWKNNNPNPGTSRKLIPIREILVAVGREAEADDMLKEASDQRHMDEVFSRFSSCSAATPLPSRH